MEDGAETHKDSDEFLADRQQEEEEEPLVPPPEGWPGHQVITSVNSSPFGPAPQAAPVASTASTAPFGPAAVHSARHIARPLVERGSPYCAGPRARDPKRPESKPPGKMAAAGGVTLDAI